MAVEVVIESIPGADIQVGAMQHAQVDVAGSTGDGCGTYNVNNLTTDLEPFVKTGIYHILLVRQLPIDSPKTPYVLHVVENPNGIVQVLCDPQGFKYRQKYGTSFDTWSDEYSYAFSEDIERIEKLAKKGIKTAKAAL